jgi:hypothetical protein
MAGKFSSIFDADDETAPKKRERYTDDTVGLFSAGKQVKDENGNARGESIDTWRVAVSDMAVAEALTQLFGGNIVENTESTADKFIDVFLAADSVSVVLSGEDAIELDYKQWVNGKLAHHCDGEKLKGHPSNPDKIGTACGCPTTFAERKQDGNDGIGPKPAIEVTFRLADDLDLGEFKMRTASWNTLKALPEIGEDLDSVGGEALASLAIEHVEFTSKTGKMKGKLITYNFPTLRGIRSYNAAIAE